MRVDKLKTDNFRNLASVEIQLDPGVNLFVGENGQGKTNLLEAVFLFKFGRSFRTHRDAELIRFEEPFCRSEAVCSFDDGHCEDFAISIERSGRKKISISDKELATLSELVGRYPVVLFGPHDLRIVSGLPAERRRFVDIVGSMTDTSYMRLLKDYRRILLQRNAALKRRVSRMERETWNSELVDKGIDVIFKRKALTEKLEVILLEHIRKLNVPFEFHLQYHSAILHESEAVAGNGATAGRDDMRTVFETKLFSLEAEEKRRGTTLVGPHRDDMIVRLAGRDVKKFGSQGQRRLLAILLKLSEMTFVEAENRESCVLLLDDVFSEFDSSITGRLQGLLQSGRQVLITSPVSLDWAASSDVRVFAVNNGSAAA